MNRRFKSLAGDESGLISVSAVLGIAFLGLIVYLLLAALDADTTHYGEVPIPSQNAQIELPSGETDMYLSETGPQTVVSNVEPPADLQYSFTAEDGAVVRVDDRSGDSKETDDGVTRIIGAVIAPEAGTYFVTVSSDEAAKLPQPALTFGLSPLGAVHERFNDIVDTLNGPTGIAVLIGLLLLFLAPRLMRALER